MKQLKKFENKEIITDTCEFRITGFNLDMLNALTKYAMMLDHVTNAQPDEQLNVDGVINTILDEGLKREIKDLIKQHGFMDMDEFIETMRDCQDGEEVHHACKYRESMKLKRAHDKILAQIPIEDKQARLPI